MENISKALLIAASVLIFIIVASFGVYMFRRLSGQAKELTESFTVAQKDEFNQKFMNYDGRNNLTIHDFMSVYYLVEDANKKGLWSTTITIKLNGSPIDVLPLNNGYAMLYNLMQYKDNDGNTHNVFRCDVSFDNKLGIVNLIEFNSV